MSKLTCFTLHYKDPTYDRANNPLRRSMGELLPIAVSWSDHNRTIRIDFSTNGVACPLADSSGVAIVDCPFAKARNKAYVLNSDGSERFAVAKPENDEANAIFSDVYYVNGMLNFFLSGEFGDRRIECDATTGRILGQSETR